MAGLRWFYLVLSDKMAYRQIVGSLMKNPAFLLEYQDIHPNDFDLQIARICFILIQKLYNEGATSLTPIEIDQEVEKHANSYVIYQKEHGLDFVKSAYEFAEVSNFFRISAICVVLQMYCIEINVNMGSVC